MKKFLSVSIGAIGTVAFLPLIAMAATSERASPSYSANVECMQQSANVRGSALINTFEAFHDAVTLALKNRITAESNAWGESDAKTREKALRDASKTFDEAYRKASKDLERQKNAVWQQFAKDSQACRTKPFQAPVCKPNEMNGARGAYFECYDGAEIKRSADTCQSSDSWQKVGKDFCKGHCSKESGKCGVNTFSALDLCSKNNCSDKSCVAYCPDGTKYDSCVQYFADPCMNHGGSSSSGQPSITILSPNGGETFKNDWATMTVKWETKNVPSSHKTLSMRLRVYPNGQDYYLPFDGKNDGQESVSIPPYIPGGSYILEIKSDVNGTTVMDASDSYVKIVDTPTPTASEQVKCVFKGATTVQSCDNASESDTPFPFSCSGIGSCVADLKGPKGLSVTWKSSCGGYAYTTLDGESEYATFSCGKTTVPKN